MNFSTQIKQSNTDEWYTPKESVDIIIPFLVGGGTSGFYAPSTRKRVTS